VQPEVVEELQLTVLSPNSLVASGTWVRSVANAFSHFKRVQNDSNTSAAAANRLKLEPGLGRAQRPTLPSWPRAVR
jgi:hypothetical protein